MKTISTVSGGKDSLAATLFYTNKWLNGDFYKLNLVFCDTGFENPITYAYLAYLSEKFGKDIKFLVHKRTEKADFTNFFEMVKFKKRFPSTKARFCTIHLKVEPMIDYILDEINDDFLVIKGERAEESANRAKLEKNCTFFKHYKELNKSYSYRRKEVLDFVKTNADEVLRPILNWNKNEVFDYIKKNGFEWNPLYDKGMQRVGCFPCIMSNKSEMKVIIDNFMSDLKILQDFEQKLGRSFFPPGYIPKRFCKNNQYPTIDEVIFYLKNCRWQEPKSTLFDTCNDLVTCHC